MEGSADGPGDPRMTESLRLMIADIVEAKRLKQPELADDNNFDATLLALAGLGLASFVEVPGDELIWIARPALVDKFELGLDYAIV